MKRGSGNGSMHKRTWKFPAKTGERAPTMQQRAEHVRDQAKRYSRDEVIRRLTKRPT